MEANTINEEDVIQVANSIHKTLTPEQIQEVIKMYPYDQEQDPTGNWHLVVENCIYQVID